MLVTLENSLILLEAGFFWGGNWHNLFAFRTWFQAVNFQNKEINGLSRLLTYKCSKISIIDETPTKIAKAIINPPK